MTIRPHQPIPFDFWPEHDRILWRSGLQRGSRRTKERRPASLSDAYKLGIVRDASDSLGWLAHHNRFDPKALPSERWSFELLDAMVMDMLAAGYTSRSALTRVCRLKRCLRIQEPHIDLSYFDAVTCQFEIRPATLKPILWSVTSGDLQSLGLETMNEAETLMEASASPLLAAELYRTGLQIALIAARPWRRKNFTSITLWEQLNKTNGTWRLSVPASETKQRHFQSGSIPEKLVPRLERYIDHYRKILCADQYFGNAIWVTKASAPQSGVQFYNEFCRSTSKRFGAHITPHDVRKIAATTIAIHNPKQVHALQGILGHGSGPLVAEQFYNLANSIEAGRSLDKTIDDISKRAKRARGRHKRGLS
jgi:hypothetical protein